MAEKASSGLPPRGISARWIFWDSIGTGPEVVSPRVVGIERGPMTLMAEHAKAPSSDGARK